MASTTSGLGSETAGGPSIRRRLMLAAAAVVLLAVIGAGAFAVYRDQIAPYRTVVLVVDGKRIDMGYFLKRVRMSGRPPLSVLQALTFEEIVKSVAPGPPYDVSVSDADVDGLLRESARESGGADLSEAEYDEWYRQQLNESELSDAEFGELSRTRLLMRGMRDYLAARVPATAEQVRLKMIAFASRADAEAARARLGAGADFDRLARELNADPELQASGGDLGWHSRAILAPNLARIAFDLLALGEASEPVALDAETFAILTVAERAPSRPLDEDNLAAAKAQRFDDWIAEEFRNHKVEYHGFSNGFDSATDLWVREQVARRAALSGGAP